MINGEIIVVCENDDDSDKLSKIINRRINTWSSYPYGVYLRYEDKKLKFSGGQVECNIKYYELIGDCYILCKEISDENDIISIFEANKLDLI